MKKKKFVQIRLDTAYLLKYKISIPVLANLIHHR